MDNDALFLARMNVTQFRKFKAALRILTNAGVNTEQSINILVTAHNARTWDARNQREYLDRLRSNG